MTTRIHRSREQIFITKSHLFALGTSTILVVLISFFLGFRAGAAQHAPSSSNEPPQLLPDADQQNTLEELLRQIEQAQQERPERTFQFPSELPNNDSRPVPELPKEVREPTQLPATNAAPQPKVDTEECSAVVKGWFVQVHAFQKVEDAIAHTDTLSEKLDVGVHCYTAMVNDTIWYRVRVGPYESESIASTKLILLETLLDDEGFIVTEVP